MTYKLVHGSASSYLSDLLKPFTPLCTLRSQNAGIQLTAGPFPIMCWVFLSVLEWLYHGFVIIVLLCLSCSTVSALNHIPNKIFCYGNKVILTSNLTKHNPHHRHVSGCEPHSEPDGCLNYSRQVLVLVGGFSSVVLRETKEQTLKRN